MGRIVAWLVTVAAFVSLPGTSSGFHSPRYGYSVVIPDAWVEMPAEVIAYSNETNGKLKNKFITDSGFAPDSTASWLEGPYVLIGATLSDQIPERRFGEVLDALRKADGPSGRLKDMLSTDAAKELNLGPFQTADRTIDTQRHGFRYSAVMPKPGEPTAYMDCAGLFGRRYLLMAVIYWFEGQEAPSQSERDAILQSLVLDPGEAYDSSIVAQWGDILSKLLAGLIIAGVLALINKSRDPGRWKWSFGKHN